MFRANNSNKNAQVPGNFQRGPVPPRPSNGPRHRNRHMCRTSEYMPPGSQVVGLSPLNQPSKVVWELDYGLSKTKFEELSARFPGIAFVQVGFDCHDHPIAHTSYRVVWENVIKKIKPGSLVADISGNPLYNEHYNKSQSTRTTPSHIDTFCKVESTKDSVRSKTRWGPKVAGDGTVRWEEMSLYDMFRNDDNRARFARYDVHLLNHVLYYYTMEEVNRLLNLNKDSVCYATMHKLPGQSGSINCGEQTYTKDLQSGKVRQTNVETGEYYEHPNPEPWFSQFCYADRYGAMAWTINKGCDDTYVLTITSAEPKLVPEEFWHGGHVIFNNGTETVDVLRVADADPPPVYALEEVVIKPSDFIPGYVGGKELLVTITHPDLYKTLKSYMINKPRNARTLQDLTAKAHREVGNNTLLGTNRRVAITSDNLTKHIFAAWRDGTALEAALFSGVVSNSSGIGDVNRNLSGRTLATGPSNALKQALRVALGVQNIVKSKDTLETVLRHVDELL